MPESDIIQRLDRIIELLSQRKQRGPLIPRPDNMLAWLAKRRNPVTLTDLYRRFRSDLTLKATVKRLCDEGRLVLTTQTSNGRPGKPPTYVSLAPLDNANPPQ